MAKPRVLAKTLRPAVKSRTTSPPRLLAPDGQLAVDARLLEQVFDSVHDIAFFIKDAAGRYVVVNQSLVDRNGLRSKQELLGKRPCDVCPGELGQIPSAQDAKVIRTGRPLVDHLELHWQVPHRPVWCLTTKLPIRNSTGGVIGLIGLSRDVRQAVPPKDIPLGMTRAIEFLEERYGEALSPVKLAEQSGMSATRFARLVRRIYGVTPSQLITQTRLTAAAALLSGTDHPVASIALACGFYDHSAFTRAFHSATGQTPTEHRRLNRSKSGS